MRPKAEIMRAARGLLPLLMALVICLGFAGAGGSLGRGCVAATAPGALSAAIGAAPWVGSDRGQEVERESDDPAPDEDSDSSVDVDDGDQKVDAVMAMAGVWLSRTPQLGSRLVLEPPRMWRSVVQLGPGLPRAPPTFS